MVALLATPVAVPSSVARSDDVAYVGVNFFGSNPDLLNVLLGGGGRPIARVTLVSPPGYKVRLDQPAGFELGIVNLVLRRLDKGSFRYGGGRLRVDDPDRYVTDPAAQACAPGRHAAVWSVPVASFGLPPLPIFVDPSPTGSASGITLRWCPVWRAEGGFRVALLSMQLAAEFGTTAALENGTNAWSALLAPRSSQPNQAWSRHELSSLFRTR